MILSRPGTRRAASLAVVIGCSAGLLQCGPGEPPPPLYFVDASLETGVRHVGPSWSLAVADYDNDGLPDLYSGNHGEAPILYRNLGGRFENVTDRALPALKGDTHGAAWADFDNDGDPDLVELRGAGRGEGEGRNRLFVNQAGRFQNRGDRLGVSDPLGRGRTPLWMDWNRDGRLDLILNNGPREGAPSLLMLATRRDFRPSSETRLGSEASFFALSRPGTREPEAWLFGNVPARVVTPGTTARSQADLPRATDAVFEDLDGDGEFDLLVIRRSGAAEIARDGARRLLARLPLDRDEKGIEFSTRGPVTFRLEPSSRRWWQEEHVAIGVRGDSPNDMPVFTLGRDQARGNPAARGGQKSIRIGYDPETRRWSLRAAARGSEVLNVVIGSANEISEVTALGFDEGSGRGWLRWFRGPDFAEDTSNESFGEVHDCRSIAAADFDNDADIDLYLVCSGPAANQRNRLLENLGEGRFEDTGAGAATSLVPEGTGDRVAISDFDRDGALDLWVTNGADLAPFNRGPIQVFHNRGDVGRWLEFELHGRDANRDALGTLIEVDTGEKTQSRWVSGGIHAATQNDRIAHFGVGDYDGSGSVTITWPSGRTQVLRGLPSNHVFHMIEPRRRRPGRAESRP